MRLSCLRNTVHYFFSHYQYHTFHELYQYQQPGIFKKYLLIGIASKYLWVYKEKSRRNQCPGSFLMVNSK